MNDQDTFLELLVPDGPCLVHGVGRVKWDFRGKPAHRWAYESFVGPIPPGYVLDRHCENPACVFVLHLEPVTKSEYANRMWASRTNILVSRGGRFSLEGAAPDVLTPEEKEASLIRPTCRWLDTPPAPDPARVTSQARRASWLTGLDS